MDINASIVDQRLQGIVEQHRNLLPPGSDAIKIKSTAFVLLCTATCLGIELEEASGLITEGGGDAGVDAIQVGDVDDLEFTVSIFQGKYHHKNLDGTKHFRETDVITAINTLATLFDPSKAIHVNDQLKPKLEEIRSLISDGYIPNVRMILCSNGQKWNQEAQRRIDQTGFPPEQVQWIYLNHHNIVDVLKKQKSVSASIQLQGEAVVEDFNFRRVLIGKVPVTQIADLFNQHGDQLLERNIRRYLGINRNRVNNDIRETLLDNNKRSNFYFFNNGITMICRKFRHNALQGKNYQLKLEDVQIINGGQTCKTIQATLNQPHLLDDFNETYVLLRLYELAENDQIFVQDITFATNSQNPVDLRDLRSNDTLQAQLEIGIEDLGYDYRRKRDDMSVRSNQVTNTIVAEATLAIWKKKPHLAKFKRSELFGKLYHSIFDDLNAAQAILAALIFRRVENERKRPVQQKPPEFLPYASHYIAMLVGGMLIKSSGVTTSQITHQHFPALLNNLNQNSQRYQHEAQEKVQLAITALYGEREISLQQMSATFRRGDLLLYLTL